MFKDFDIYSHNRHTRPKRNFEEHFRAHQQGPNRHKRHFQGAFGAGLFEDLSDDMERMFTFDRHAKRTDDSFPSMTKQHCRTVTQRRGNMVTTYTDCTSSWENTYRILLVIIELFCVWIRQWNVGTRYWDIKYLYVMTWSTFRNWNYFI